MSVGDVVLVEGLGRWMVAAFGWSPVFPVGGRDGGLASFASEDPAGVGPTDSRGERGI